MDPAQGVILVLLLAGGPVSVLAWTARWPLPATCLSLALLLLAAAVASVSPAGAGATSAAAWAAPAVIASAGVLAVSGGGPVTMLVFSLVDRPATPEGPGRVVEAAEILRGGAWIGSLERAAIYATLVAGWPEGVAVVLGLKGLGRYQELRGDPVTGTAERFIIGTFSSVLWAVACAAVALGGT